MAVFEVIHVPEDRPMKPWNNYPGSIPEMGQTRQPESQQECVAPGLEISSTGSRFPVPFVHQPIGPHISQGVSGYLHARRPS